MLIVVNSVHNFSGNGIMHVKILVHYDTLRSSNRFNRNTETVLVLIIIFRCC